jgi:hypothetical protein
MKIITPKTAVSILAAIVFIVLIIQVLNVINVEQATRAKQLELDLLELQSRVAILEKQNLDLLVSLKSDESTKTKSKHIPDESKIC